MFNPLETSSPAHSLRNTLLTRFSQTWMKRLEHTDHPPLSPRRSPNPPSVLVLPHLAAALLIILYFGLFFDRGKSRRRCPDICPAPRHSSVRCPSAAVMRKRGANSAAVAAAGGSVSGVSAHGPVAGFLRAAVMALARVTARSCQIGEVVEDTCRWHPWQPAPSSKSERPRRARSGSFLKWQHTARR